MALTHLERGRVSRTYINRLKAGWASVMQFMASMNILMSSICHDALQLDDAIANYVQYCFDQGIALSLTRHGVLSVQYKWRAMRGKLGRAWDANKSWQLRIESRHRVPMHRRLLNGICV